MDAAAAQTNAGRLDNKCLFNPRQLGIQRHDPSVFGSHVNTERDIGAVYDAYPITNSSLEIGLAQLMHELANIKKRQQMLKATS